MSQQSWQSCAAPASPGALVQFAVVPPLLDPLLVLLPLDEVLPLLEVLPLDEVLPLLELVLPLLDEVLPLLLPEPLELDLPASLLNPGVLAVLEQPEV